MMNYTKPMFIVHLLVTTIACDATLNYYACRALLNYQSMSFNFNCPAAEQVMYIESALIGFSDQYAGGTTPVCPWTSKTSTTCAAIGITTEDCNCTKSTDIPAQTCNGQHSCTFSQSILNRPNGNPLCVLSNEGNFISVNYTCSTPTTVMRSSSTMRVAVTTLGDNSPSLDTNMIASFTTLSTTVSTLGPENSATTMTIASFLSSSVGNLSPTNSEKAISFGSVAGIVIGSVATIGWIVVVVVLIQKQWKKKSRRSGTAMENERAEAMNRQSPRSEIQSQSTNYETLHMETGSPPAADYYNYRAGTDANAYEQLSKTNQRPHGMRMIS